MQYQYKRTEYNAALARLSVGARVQIGKEIVEGVAFSVYSNDGHWHATVYDTEPDYDGTILVTRESDGMVVCAHPLDMFVADAAGRLIEQE